MRSLFVGALLLLAIDGSAAAQTKTMSAHAIGYGATQPEALSDALAKAVAQVNGANVSSSSAVRTTAIEGTVNDSSGQSESFSANVQQSNNSSFNAHGQVASYKILSSSKEDKAFRVEVSAQIYRYETPGNSESRRRIALLPVRTASDWYDFFGSVRGSDLAAQLGSALEAELVQSRRFSVLDRTTLSASLEELSFIGSDLTSPAEKAKLQQMKGADYMLLPSIKTASSFADSRRNPVTGQIMGRFDFEIELRVVIPATSEIKYSETYILPGAAGREPAIEDMSRVAIADVVEKIYPARVVGIAGEEIIINSGGRSVAAGDRYVIMSEGAALKDPYTGESLGRVESRIGTAEVIRSEGKVSYLQLLDGSLPSIKREMTARREGQNPPLPEAPRETPGVKLPFEK